MTNLDEIRLVKWRSAADELHEHECTLDRKGKTDPRYKPAYTGNRKNLRNSQIAAIKLGRSEEQYLDIRGVGPEVRALISASHERRS
jgi:hypothetical protein